MNYTDEYSEKTDRLKSLIENAEAIVIGAGAGLSTAAGFTYSGKRFHENFHDFEAKYNFHDMYSGGFYPYDTPEEFWAYWSRYIFINRYLDPPKPVYNELFELVKDKNYFVITTNVDHCFQKAGFDKQRLFYTQGDYGLLRSDDKFVEDDGWHLACERYERFIKENKNKKVLYLELGVGMNTPVIIKYPFWRLTAQNKNAHYVCVNTDMAYVPDEIKERSLCFAEDISDVINALKIL